MLFDPNWKTKTDPRSLRDFIAWLETKDPKEGYRYDDKRTCLLTQWVRHCDADAESGARSLDYIVHGQTMDFYGSSFHLIANGGEDCTLGAALERAKGYLAAQERENA